LARGEQPPAITKNDSSDSAPDVAAPTVTASAGPARSSPGTLGRRDPVQIVSNARGPYPQLEMYNVPRRHHTISGATRTRSGGASRGGDGPSSSQIYSPFENVRDPTARTMNSVRRRLADMGFTDESYPSINDKVANRMSTTIADNADISKDVEDGIVSDVLEELLDEPAPDLNKELPPQPTGSMASTDYPAAGAAAGAALD